MSGFHEILIVVIIILAIFFVPRLTAKQAQHHRFPVRAKSLPALTGKLRLLIVFSIMWPILLALYFEPWHKSPIPFVYVAVLPVIISWAGYWVIVGYRKYKK